MSVCTDCPAFMHGIVDNMEHGFMVRMFDHCLFWKWVSISAVMPTFPPDTCVDGEALKARSKNYDTLVLTVKDKEQSNERD